MGAEQIDKPDDDFQTGVTDKPANSERIPVPDQPVPPQQATETAQQATETAQQATVPAQPEPAQPAPVAPHPTVLFVCIHNAGRSQMAAGYLTALSNGAVTVRSGGSEPGHQINPTAVAAMAEEGIDISQGVPQLMTTEQVRDSDVVITMGCGDVCPIFPGKRYEDWQLDDPAGRGLEEVRMIRDDIKRRVGALLAELQPGMVER